MGILRSYFICIIELNVVIIILYNCFCAIFFDTLHILILMRVSWSKNSPTNTKYLKEVLFFNFLDHSLV